MTTGPLAHQWGTWSSRHNFWGLQFKSNASLARIMLSAFPLHPTDSPDIAWSLVGRSAKVVPSGYSRTSVNMDRQEIVGLWGIPSKSTC